MLCRCILVAGAVLGLVEGKAALAAEVTAEAGIDISSWVPAERLDAPVVEFDELFGTILPFGEPVGEETLAQELFVTNMRYGVKDGFVIMAKLEGLTGDGRSIYEEWIVDQELSSFEDFAGWKIHFDCTNPPQGLLVESIEYRTDELGSLYLASLAGHLDSGAPIDWQIDRPTPNGSFQNNGTCTLNSTNLCKANPTCGLFCQSIISCGCVGSGNCDIQVRVNCDNVDCTLPRSCLFDGTTCVCGTPTPGPTLTEVVDGTLPGGQPKWVELTNLTGGPIDMSQYSIGNYNNGGTLLGGGSSTPFNPVILNPGESYVFAYETSTNTGCGGGVSCFEFVHGQPPDQFSGAFTNGNDAIAVFLGIGNGDGSNAPMVDVYGEIGVDGIGTVWDYTDSYAYRCVDGPNPIFEPCEWVFFGPDALEDPGGDDALEQALIQAATTPFNFVPCPSDPCVAPLVYCTPKPSSAGCVTLIAHDTGLPISGASDYALHAFPVQGFKNGLLFAGISGPANIPFSGGVLCVQPPNKRGPILNSGGSSPLACDGVYSLIVNDGNVIPFGLEPGPGNTAWYQWWYRDPGNGAGNLGTALTDAAEVLYL